MKIGATTERTLTLALCAGVFVLAFLARAWTNTWLVDFWGDSYHHWLITRLTMLNGVYSDYKGLETVWSPLYHYLGIIPLLLAGSTGIDVLHWMNTFWGALSCALSAFLAWKLFAGRIASIAAGLVLAFMTWHIAFSGMNVAEVFCGLLALGVTLLVISQPETSNPIRDCLLFILALAMPLTRTDLSIYLAIVVAWLWIQRRRKEAVIISSAVGLALAGWSWWSFYKTGDPLHWYQQYTQNNLHDWLLLNSNLPNAAFAFAEYMNRLSPWVLPALLGGLLALVSSSGARRRALWLVMALLAGHSLFLIVGYARGIVPLLTERYLVIDLPFVAALLGAWVVTVGDALRYRNRAANAARARIIPLLVACILITTTFNRFQSEIPELQIRRWAIDPEWQIGNFLYAQAQPGEVVLTDAPVAIYRSGKPLTQFISSVTLAKQGDPLTALKTQKVRWIVTQPVSYDAASAFIPPELLAQQSSGVVNGLYFDLVWRYDPARRDIQSEVWHVIQVGQ